jgi:hypothetical protein
MLGKNFSGETYGKVTTEKTETWEDNIKMDLRKMGCEKEGG